MDNGYYDTSLFAGMSLNLLGFVHICEDCGNAIISKQEIEMSPVYKLTVQFGILCVYNLNSSVL